MRNLKLVLVSLAVIWLASCNEEKQDHPLANQTPKTFMWLFPDSTVGVGVSRQHLRWWGEDPDGVVIGYLFAFNITTDRVNSLPNPDTLTYSWVTANDTLLLFPLDTLFRKFTVYVRSVDNSFRGLPNHSIVRFAPGPYWDVNANGVFDAGDEQLPALTASLDPKGAVQTVPGRNTPPQGFFASTPLNANVPLKQPDTTFTVATFGWKATDPDGDNTLASYRIALNDTSDPSRWVTIPLRDTVVTLVVRRAVSDSAGAEVAADLYSGSFLGRRLVGSIRGLRLNALNRLFLQAKDVAGEYSPALTMPSASSIWFVKRPRPRPNPQAKTVLLVSDYINSDSGSAEQTYRNALANIQGGDFSQVDRLNIGMGLTATVKGDYNRPEVATGVLVPPFVDPALIQTFLLYDYVIWYTDQYPSIRVAQFSLFPYIQNGGKLIFSTTFLVSGDPRVALALRDFAPIDSVSSGSTTAPFPRLVDTRIPASYKLLADSTDLDPASIYPQLALNSPPPAFHSQLTMRPIYRRTDARYIYHLQADTANAIPRYIGKPNIAVVDGQRRNLFIGLPLHLLNGVENGGRGLTEFFTKAITREFSPTHNVDRRKF